MSKSVFIPFIIKSIGIVSILFCAHSILFSLTDVEQPLFDRTATLDTFRAAVATAVKNKNLEVRNAGGYTPLLFWTLNSDKARAEILLDAGANIEARMPDPDKRTPIHMAVSSADQLDGGDLVVLLLERGADLTTVEERGNLPLHWVIRIDNINTRFRVLTLLMMMGADINSKGEMGNTLMHMQVKKFDILGVVGLRDLFGIELDLSVRNEAGQTAIEYADSFLFTDIEAALQAKPDVVGLSSNNPNIYDRMGLTALQHAVIGNKLDLATELLKKPGITIDAPSQTPLGFTALEIALLWGNIPMAQLLLSKKASLSVRDGQGKTPLHRILLIRDPATRIKMLDFLLKSGANPQTTDTKGNTILHDIVVRGDEALLSHIVKTYPSRFNPQIKNSAYDTPVDLARKRQAEKIQGLLVSL